MAIKFEFWSRKQAGTIDTYIDYQTASLLHLLLPFFKEMKTTGFYLKK